MKTDEVGQDFDEDEWLVVKVGDLIINNAHGFRYQRPFVCLVLEIDHGMHRTSLKVLRTDNGLSDYFTLSRTMLCRIFSKPSTN
tara:strand:+ start:516 stop:767 length:252 start_codon:yes stop_codon:yes gene_type:complete